MPTNVDHAADGRVDRRGNAHEVAKKPGDAVKRDEPLFEISTDKVDAEIPRPASGTLSRSATRGRDGARSTRSSPSSGRRGEQAGPPAPAGLSRPPRQRLPLSRRLPRQLPRRSRRPRPLRRPPPSRPRKPRKRRRSSATPANPHRPRRVEAAESDVEERLRKFSSPLVRNIAAKEGVDLGQVTGTGAHGRVTKDDILGHLEQRKSRPLRRGSSRRRSGSGRQARRGSHARSGSGRRGAFGPASAAGRLPRGGLHRGGERRDRADVQDAADHGGAHGLLEGHLGARHDAVPHRHVEDQQGPLTRP